MDKPRPKSFLTKFPHFKKGLIQRESLPVHAVESSPGLLQVNWEFPVGLSCRTEGGGAFLDDPAMRATSISEAGISKKRAR